MIKNIYRRGFTLVELLVTIVLLGVVGGIIIYNMTGISTSSKDTEYERFVAAVKSAAATYAEANTELTESLYIDKAFVYVTVDDLIQNGYLDEKSVNPYTGEYINPDEKVKASLDSTTGAVIYEYPVEDTEHKESYLVAMDDFMVYGEPYDCFSGFGTYEFSIAGEDGTLVIPKADSENEWERSVSGIIKHYGVTCEMPDDFYFYDDQKVRDHYNGTWGAATTNEMINNINNNHAEYYFLNIQDPKYRASTYDIKYTWVSETGTKKQFKRKLRSMDKARAVLSFNKTYYNSKYEGNYDEETKQRTPFYDKPEFDGSSKNWYPLAYTVTLEGADNSSALVDLEVRNTKGQMKYKYARQGDVSGVDVKNGSYYLVDDGENFYHFSYTVIGHHLKTYSYNAESEYLLASDLVIPTYFISKVASKGDGIAIDTNGNAIWETARAATVSGGVTSAMNSAAHKVAIAKGATYIDVANNHIYSPTGIKYIEYIGVDSKSETPLATGRYNTIASLNEGKRQYDNALFGFSGETATVNVNALATSNLSNWRYIRVRAVNNDGFVGSWSDPVPIYVSDKIDNIAASYCSHGGCTSSAASGSNGCSTESLSITNGIKAKYNDRRVTVNMNGMSFVVADATSENGVTTAIAGSATIGFSTMKVQTGTWGVNTCDGYYSTSYSYTTVESENIAKKISEQCQAGIPSQYVQQNLCSVGASKSWSPYYGWLDKAAANSFGAGVSGGGTGSCLWDSSTRTVSFSVSVSHGESTTKSSTYQNAYNISGGSITTIKTDSASYTCGVKCYVKFRPRVYIISGGSGSYNLSLYR